MDIGSKCDYPASELSNFAAHEFVIDGVKCASMEGFLQSLKFQDPEIQKQVCTLVGYEAKSKGKLQIWYSDQILYWQGKQYARRSREYQNLLNRAFLELSKNNDFRIALLETGNSKLTHSIGRSDPSRTVLTEEEFCRKLTLLRSLLRVNKALFPGKYK